MKAPAAGVLRIGGGNVYFKNPNPRRAVGVAVATRCHSWGWSEGSKIAPLLRERKGYDALTFMGSDNMVDANDCVMQVRKSLDVVHFSMTRACQEVKGSKVGQERHFSMVAYRAPMLGPQAVVCHIAVHPNWVVGLDSPSNPVVREYVRSMVALHAMLTFARSMGWYIVVTGDFNTRQGKGHEKRFETIYDVFKDFRLTVKVDGIDGAAWDRRLVLAGASLIPRARTKTDHPNWLVVDLRRRK